MSGATRIRLTQPRFSAALVIGLMVIGAFACKSYEFIEIVNGTDEVTVISVRSDDRPASEQHVIQPDESVALGTRVGTGMTFAVYDYGNTLIAELGFSWEELQAMDFRVTIRDADLTTSE